MAHTNYLVLAYMTIWAGLAGYLIWISGRQRQIARRLEELASRVKQQEVQP